MIEGIITSLVDVSSNDSIERGGFASSELSDRDGADWRRIFEGVIGSMSLSGGRKASEWALRVGELKEGLDGLVSYSRTGDTKSLSAARPVAAVETADKARDLVDGLWRVSTVSLTQSDVEATMHAVSMALIEWARVFVGHPKSLWALPVAGIAPSSRLSHNSRRCRAAHRVIGGWHRTCNELANVIWSSTSTSQGVWKHTESFQGLVGMLEDVCKRCNQAFALRSSADELLALASSTLPPSVSAGAIQALKIL